MLMRLREAGFVALVFVTGATLLPMSRASARSTVPVIADVTSNVAIGVVRSSRLAAHGPVWAQAAPSPEAFRAILRSNPTVGAPSPDGLRFLAVTTTVGPNPPVQLLTNAATVADLLRALNVRIRRSDLVIPERSTALSNGAVVQVLRVDQVVRTSVVQLPFETLIQPSSQLPVGQSQVIFPGAAGRARLTYRITYVNGEPVVRQLIRRKVLAPVVTRVEIQGTQPPAASGSQPGQATWYSCRADGMFAANLMLPFGTKVTVSNVDNGSSVTVVINDRGPYGVPGRIIDLCPSAFAAIAPLGQGVANVTISW